MSKTITRCFQEQQAHDEEEEGIGDTKLRGPADATSGAFDSGEAADNLPFVSLPDTEMEGGDDPQSLAMVTADNQTIMNEQALRIQANEAKSGHHLQDAIITSRFSGDLLAIPLNGNPRPLIMEPFVAPADHRLHTLKDGTSILAVPEQDRGDRNPWKQKVKIVRLPDNF